MEEKSKISKQDVEYRIFTNIGIWIANKEMSVMTGQVLNEILREKVDEIVSEGNASDDPQGQFIRTVNTVLNDPATRKEIRERELRWAYNHLTGIVKDVCEDFCAYFLKTDRGRPPLCNNMQADARRKELVDITVRLVDRLEYKKHITKKERDDIIKMLQRKRAEIFNAIPQRGRASSPREILEASAPFVNEALCKINMGKTVTKDMH